MVRSNKGKLVEAAAGSKSLTQMLRPTQRAAVNVINSCPDAADAPETSPASQALQSLSVDGDNSCDRACLSPEQAPPETHQSVDVVVPTTGGACTPVVTCLEDEFKWAQHNFCVAGRELSGRPPLDLYCEHAAQTMSTAFSGIDAAGVAENIMTCAAQGLLLERSAGVTSPLQRGHHLCAIEWDPQCRIELKMMPHPPQCIFGDVMNFCSHSLQNYCAHLVDYDFEVLNPLFLEPGAVSLVSYCYACEKQCTYKHSHGHVQGSPCTDFSSMGTLKGTCGKTICYWLAWSTLMLMVRPFWVVCENVKSFPVWIVEAMFGHIYDIHSAVLCGTSLGKAARRERRYTLMTLRSAVCLTRPLSDATRLFGRVAAQSHSWRNYLLAGTSELRSELRWAYNRASCIMQLDGMESLDADLFEKALNDGETERKELFLSEYNGAHKVLSLGQNPDHQQTMSGEQILHCITRSCHLMWSTDHGRWLSVREMLLAQGFPTFDTALAAVQPHCPNNLSHVSSFNVSRIQRGMSSRNRVAVSHQCGNTMQVDVVGTVLFWVSLFVRRAPSVALSLAPSVQRVLASPVTPTSTTAATPHRAHSRIRLMDESESQDSLSCSTSSGPSASTSSVPASVSKRRRTSSQLRAWSAESLKFKNVASPEPH